MKRFWRGAGSLKIGIILLSLITVASIVGVIIPQGLPASSYTSRWGNMAGSLLLSIQLDRLFFSHWYNILLTLFAGNIICCTTSRIAASIKKISHSHFLNCEQIKTLTSYAEMTSGRTVDDIVGRIVAVFRKKRLYINSTSVGTDIMIDARRGRFRDVGSALLHLSFLFLLVGGLIAKLTGFSYMQYLTPGETVLVKDRQFKVRCDFFTIERNRNGSIKDYISGLTLLEIGGDTLMRKVIEVNHPLVYKGIKIYQSGWSSDPSKIGTIRLVVTGPGVGAIGKAVDCIKGTPTALDGTDITVTADRFIPDFVIDLKTKMPQSRSKQHNNPAIYVTIRQKNNVVFSGWIFQKFGAMHNKNNSYNVSFTSYERREATGLLIKENPGSPIIWFGIISMSFGLLLVFWVPRKRYWSAVCHGTADGLATVIVGTSINREDTEELRQWQELQQHCAESIKEQ